MLGIINKLLPRSQCVSHALLENTCGNHPVVPRTMFKFLDSTWKSRVQEMIASGEIKRYMEKKDDFSFHRADAASVRTGEDRDETLSADFKINSNYYGAEFEMENYPEFTLLSDIPPEYDIRLEDYNQKMLVTYLMHSLSNQWSNTDGYFKSHSVKDIEAPMFTDEDGNRYSSLEVETTDNSATVLMGAKARFEVAYCLYRLWVAGERYNLSLVSICFEDEYSKQMFKSTDVVLKPQNILLRGRVFRQFGRDLFLDNPLYSPTDKSLEHFRNDFRSMNFREREYYDKLQYYIRSIGMNVTTLDVRSLSFDFIKKACGMFIPSESAIKGQVPLFESASTKKENPVISIVNYLMDSNLSSSEINRYLSSSDLQKSRENAWKFLAVDSKLPQRIGSYGFWLSNRDGDDEIPVMSKVNGDIVYMCASGEYLGFTKNNKLATYLYVDNAMHFLMEV